MLNGSPPKAKIEFPISYPTTISLLLEDATPPAQNVPQINSFLAVINSSSANPSSLVLGKKYWKKYV